MTITSIGRGLLSESFLVKKAKSHVILAIYTHMGTPREKGQGTKRRQLRHTPGALPDTRMEPNLYDHGKALFSNTEKGTIRQ